ncbi:hypothetical protein BJP40_06715 [Streptomyces sp. CC53]|uniref:hypothetical protein n=1 Tax=Streptomyces sp. CC53 TaxID=1906740 RepID=UPI0008DD35CC|nr:hypothetical protein [Streptomyces sp. CC53]OII61213.1 hypothetical protein BJP40_06715 [Streptomyces sp. CC53]
MPAIIRRRGRDMTFLVVPGPEVQRVSAALGQEDVAIPRQSRQVVRREARRLARVAQNKVRSLPIAGSSGRHTGLRRRVAAGVRVVDVPEGAHVQTTMAERDEAIIPWGLDSPKGWRHPVFGNREVWVQQRPHVHGWFRGTFEDGEHLIEQSLEDVLERSARRIAAEGRIRPL